MSISGMIIRIRFIKKCKNPEAKMTKEEFIDNIKTDAKFAKQWGELPKIYGEMWRKLADPKKRKNY